MLTLFVNIPPRPPAELLRLLLSRPPTAVAILKFGATTIGPAEKAFRRGDDAAMMTFIRGVLGKERFERLPDLRREQMRENRGALKAPLVGAGLPPLGDVDVRGVTTSTLLVSGADSPALFRRLTDRLQELLPNTERVEIPDASHLMHEQNPAALNDAILTFLAAHHTPTAPA